MLGSAIFELAVGLVFVFLTVSLVCSTVSDKISEWLQWRAAFLEQGIREVVMGADWATNRDFVTQAVRQVYAHPAVQAQFRHVGKVSQLMQAIPGLNQDVVRVTSYMRGQQWAPPNWIPEKTFVAALLDTVAPASGQAKSVDELRNAVQTAPFLQNTHLQVALLSMLNHGETQVNDARANIEQWFDNSMNQVSDLYKRRMGIAALVIGIGVSAFFNVDTIVLANSMWHDSSLRAAAASAAGKVTIPAASTAEVQTIANLNQQLSSLNLPVGWKSCGDCTLNVLGVSPQEWAPVTEATVKDAVNPFVGFVLKLLGWAITGIAASQGAPFWYDILKKMTRSG